MSEALLGYLAAGLFAVLAVWVFAARPRGAANQAFAALLVINAVSTVAFETYRAAEDAQTAEQAIRVITWVELPLVLVLLLLLDALFLPRPRPRAWRILLVLAAAGTLLLVTLYAARPDLFHHDAIPSTSATGITRYRVAPETLAIPLGVALALTEAGAVLLASRAAGDAARSVLQRRQAALVGFAFALRVADAGTVRGVGAIINQSTQGHVGFDALPAADILGLVVVAAVLPRLVGAFAGWPRVALPSLVALAALAGLYDSQVVRIYRLDPRLVPSGYFNSRLIWIAAFALVLAVAIVRYGLPGIGPEGRRRVASTTGAAVLLGLGALGSGLALAGLGPTAAGAGGAAAAMLLVAGLAFTPLRAVPGQLTRRVLIHPDDADVVRERVRVYQAALRAAVTPDGAVPPPQAPVLAALRTELGLTEQDHELLVERLHEAPADSARPEVLLGRYFIERELGRGATSVAYLARDSVLGREVVVKRLLGLGDHARTLAAEAQALARLDHPRVVRLFEARHVGHEVLLVLEYAPGGSLEDRLARHGAVPPRDALRAVGDVLDALAAVHAAGLVHGDVKASNVVLARDGGAKLADLGTARGVRPTKDGATARTPDAGSLSSMAPEQVLGERASARTDVYAAAALLYRLLTSEHYVALDGATEREARGRILHGKPRLPHSRVPAPLSRVVARALAKDPGERYPDVASLAAALAAAGGPTRP